MKAELNIEKLEINMIHMFLVVLFRCATDALLMSALKKIVLEPIFVHRTNLKNSKIFILVNCFSATSSSGYLNFIFYCSPPDIQNAYGIIHLGNFPSHFFSFVASQPQESGPCSRYSSS